MSTRRSCEIQAISEGETDLHQYVTGCEKNRGHGNFIPVEQFTFDHLPQGYRESNVLELIKLQAELTVRLTVTFDRESRPEVSPGSDNQIPSSTDSVIPTQVGTGYITYVYMSDENQFFADTRIQTSAHLFKDQRRQAQVTCDFFFDRGNKPELCPGVITLRKFSFTRFNDFLDVCVIKTIVQDPALVKRLRNTVDRYIQVEKEVYKWYINSHELDEKNFLTVIVSHPHGCSKKISVGYCTNRNIIDGSYFTELTYTTPTCPGSSGADILLVGFTRNDHQHIHYGTDDDNNFNISNGGLDLCYYNIGYRGSRRLSDQSEEDKRNMLESLMDQIITTDLA